MAQTHCYQCCIGDGDGGEYKRLVMDDDFDEIVAKVCASYYGLYVSNDDFTIYFVDCSENVSDEN